MSEDEPQTEGMKALEQSLNDHMEICRLQRKAKRLKAENARLKAEVERLIEERCFLNEKLNHFVKQTVQNREQVERLRKAGDNLITALDKRDDVFDNSDKRQAIADWNAAKEGNQP